MILQMEMRSSLLRFKDNEPITWIVVNVAIGVKDNTGRTNPDMGC